MKRCVWLSLLLLLGTVAAVSAQEAPGTAAGARQQRPEVFAPFVSRLKATAEGPRILLSWHDCQDVAGKRLVFRSKEPITQESFGGAHFVARLEAGSARYEDTPPEQGPYHYAVLVEDPEGTLYELFIPFRNITSHPVQVASLVPEEDLAAKVSAISAQAVDDSIRVSFASSSARRELLLFRSGSPIRDTADLVAAAAPVTLSPGTTAYLDYAIPGIGYYYCVVDAELFTLGKAVAVAGQNSTASAVQIPIGVGRVGLPDIAAFRPLPLPYLLIRGAVENGEELAPSAPFQLPEPVGALRQETRAAVARLVSPPPSAAPREVEILSEDQAQEGESRGIGAGPDGRALRDIVHGELFAGDPAAAAVALQDFLRIRRTEAVEHRAHFYLGQMFYQAGRYREAFLEFLLARDSYYRQAEEWLDACFRRLWQAQ